MNNLTEGNSGKLIFAFAMPMLIGNIFQQLYSIINSVIVGHFIGKTALAAVGASFPIIFMLISFVIGITMGTTIIISQYFGANNMEKVKRAADTMYIVLFFASIVLMVLGIVLSRRLLEMINLPAEVIPQALSYFNTYMTGMLFFFGFNAISSVLRGVGDSKTPLYFLIISTVINILLDLLFIGIFKWNVEGAALATVIAQAAAFVLGVVYLNCTHALIKFRWRKFIFDKEIFNSSLRIGLPTGFQQTFVSIGMLAIMWIVNGFGTDVIAAYSVAGRIDNLAGLPAMNFGAALSAFVGQNIGAGKMDRVKSGLIATLKMSSLLAVATSILIILFRTPLMAMFTPDKNVIAIGAEYLTVIASFYLLFSTMFVIGGVMRGAGDTLIPMFITLLSLWIIRIPAAWIMSEHFGVDGIWWSIPIAWFIGMILSYLYYLSGKWKNKTLVKERDFVKKSLL